MGFWSTIVIEGKPKYWDKPNCRWKLNPTEDESLIEVVASQADYDEINADPDTVELTQDQADSLSSSWGDPPWIYPTSSELYGIGYCTVADLRARGVTEEQATDEILRESIRLATQVINSFCNRDFWRREETYLLDGDGTPVLFLDDRPVITVSSLIVDGYKLNPLEYKVYGEGGYIKLSGLEIVPGKILKGAFPEGEQNIEVTGQFGYTVIPDEVRESCIILSVEALRDLKAGIDLSSSTSSSTRNAVGLKRAKIEDISVEFEYPRSVTSDASGRITTGSIEVDSMLVKYRKDLETIAI